jgi:hypothetical protein
LRIENAETEEEPSQSARRPQPRRSASGDPDAGDFSDETFLFLRRD